MKSKMKKNRGYITLISVLIVSAIGVVISLSVIILGNAFAQSSFALQQSNQSKALANACAERALERVVSSNFTGTGDITEGFGTCTYTVASQGGENRTIMARGDVDGRIRKISIVINDILPQVNIVSWQEVAD